MSYSYPINYWNEIHKRDERTGFIVSLSFHALLFFIGGAIFVKTAHYNIQNVPQATTNESTRYESTTVELVEAPPPPVIEDMAPPKPTQKIEIKKIIVKKIEIKKQVVVKVPKNVGRVITTKADPNYFQNPPPEYPELAKQMHQEGIVMLSVDVNKEGDPVGVEIIQSSGFHMLDQAALKAVRHWKFQPGSIGGIRVDSTVTVPIRFRLEIRNGFPLSRE